jgi:hypothetical protein
LLATIVAPQVETADWWLYASNPFFGGVQLCANALLSHSLLPTLCLVVLAWPVPRQKHRRHPRHRPFSPRTTTPATAATTGCGAWRDLLGLAGLLGLRRRNEVSRGPRWRRMSPSGPPESRWPRPLPIGQCSGCFADLPAHFVGNEENLHGGGTRVVANQQKSSVGRKPVQPST